MSGRIEPIRRDRSKEKSTSERKSDMIAKKAQEVLAKANASAEKMRGHLQRGLKWSYTDQKTGKTLVDFEITDVDPGMAAMFLSNQRKNRGIQPRVVKRYASDLVNGRWMPNLEAMWLDEDLRLADGQHRCSAIVESGKTMPAVLVAIAHDEEILLSLDQGFGRTMENIQRVAGDDVMPRVVSGAVILEHNDFKSNKRSQQSIAERREILLKFPMTKDANSLVGGKKPVSVPALAVAIRCMRKNRDLALKFWNAVFSNQSIIDGEHCNQANVLSSWIYQNARRTGEAVRKETLYRCIYAWNAFRQKKNIRIIKYADSYELPEIL